MSGPKVLGPEQKASLWVVTAPQAPECLALNAAVDTDVCANGGSYTGLACALTLAENSADVVVLASGTTSVRWSFARVIAT